jgi:hypothetical protein
MAITLKENDMQDERAVSLLLQAILWMLMPATSMSWRARADRSAGRA